MRSKARASLMAAAGVVAVLLAAMRAAGAGEQNIPAFEDSFLADRAIQDAGKVLWDSQCTHCHGRNAYPGKAPKLKPRKYSPEFVYHRITYGFRKMPAWEDSYTERERMEIVAYVLSDSFSP